MELLVHVDTSRCTPPQQISAFHDTWQPVSLLEIVTRGAMYFAADAPVIGTNETAADAFMRRFWNEFIEARPRPVRVGRHDRLILSPPTADESGRITMLFGEAMAVLMAERMFQIPYTSITRTPARHDHEFLGPRGVVRLEARGRFNGRGREAAIAELDSKFSDTRDFSQAIGVLVYPSDRQARRRPDLEVLDPLSEPQSPKKSDLIRRVLRHYSEWAMRSGASSLIDLYGQLLSLRNDELTRAYSQSSGIFLDEGRGPSAGPDVLSTRAGVYSGYVLDGFGAPSWIAGINESKNGVVFVGIWNGVVERTFTTAITDLLDFYEPARQSRDNYGTLFNQLNDGTVVAWAPDIDTLRRSGVQQHRVAAARRRPWRRIPQPNGAAVTFEQGERAWLAKELTFVSPFGVRLDGDRAGHAVVPGDWVVLVDTAGALKRVGRVLRIRTNLEATTLYFDKLRAVQTARSLATIGLTLPPGLVIRLRPEDLSAVLAGDGVRSLDDVPLIQDAAYVRELLELATRDDLLGPANGPEELIVDMSVRDRYLVGKLAPRAPGNAAASIKIEPAAAADEEDDSAQEYDALLHEPGAEFNRASGRVELEDEGLDEIDTTNNQSLVPSSMGLTFCVGADVKSLDVTARWGSYARVPKEEHGYTRPRKDRETGEVQEVKVKVWRRTPRGGRVTLTLKDGPIKPIAPDSEQDEVRIQGTVRTNTKGDRLVTLFLVNDQREPETNRDSAWLFQPELNVKSSGGATDAPVFLRRPSSDVVVEDVERDHLGLIYRRRVEFAVGHGVAVHAKTPDDDPTRAIAVGTEVIPSYEVPVTEPPGLDLDDRAAMKKMVERGWLDMLTLAELDKEPLEEALKTLVDDYAAWIDEQCARVGREIKGYDVPANEALDRCKSMLERLRAGLNVLLADPNALEAFRFANRAMAQQRVRGIYALKRRRGEELTLESVEVRKNRSWRPFQLAFLLLSIPSLADPKHPDRTNPAEAFVDLLWFPTGGGKTEAYLGVAAFAMGIRRLQDVFENLDGGRGLAVIMRYTLRLLTLQQFQRAATLLCAMELVRTGDVAKWGMEPFTLGLWVGNKVTPGTTEVSHQAIEAIRDRDRNRAGIASPAQLTSCPWCGTEIQPGRDIEVDKTAGRTAIYCGDKLSQCEFTKARSSGNAHPGLPVKLVDEEIYHRPPTMMISTVDKFAMMAWRAEVGTLFGNVREECERHGLLWPGHGCGSGHRARKPHPAAKVKAVVGVRPPDLIIQDEFHLIGGPLGTMVGLYETAVDDLCSWKIGKSKIRPKVVASTATVRRAADQVRNVFMRRLAIFPPKALDVEDDFFSVQRSVESKPGRRYMGICSPGSSRPAVLIRTYTAFLTAAQGLFDAFGPVADPYMTLVGYFNSLRELGGMKRLAEDDVQTRSFRVKMSLVERPGLEQRRVGIIAELTSRVSNAEIPKYLDQLEIPFDGVLDANTGRFARPSANPSSGSDSQRPAAPRPIDVVLATNMLSVGVDVNRLGVMVVNGQPKGTAEYIQATSRVGRAFPGLVAAVLTWARPRDLSHYETFEHYHATFYQHVEAQSVTPFSPRAMDRGLTGTMLSMMRNRFEQFSPNPGAGALSSPSRPEMVSTVDTVTERTWEVTENSAKKNLANAELKSRADEWAKEAAVPGRVLVYQKFGAGPTAYALLEAPGIRPWSKWTVPMSMREVEPGVNLVMEDERSNQDPVWRPRPIPENDATTEENGEGSP
ncbi:DISARM system helicase DrmA [Tahibacter sp. UC22_41]|uniref:DISARM system helicase DrmA n=1 Tax=Tahibacter sp. UC22_41 TaxID=3350178 RepID=UPI0036DA1E9D